MGRLGKPKLPERLHFCIALLASNFTDRILFCCPTVGRDTMKFTSSHSLQRKYRRSLDMQSVNGNSSGLSKMQNDLIRDVIGHLLFNVLKNDSPRLARSVV